MFAGPAADVEDLARDRVDPVDGPLVGVDQVADPERVADLLAVAEDRERLARGRRHAEPGDPALVLDAELAGAVDARLAERRPSSARRSGRSRGRTGRPPPWSSRRGCGSPAARTRRRRRGGPRRRSGRRARRPGRARGCRRPCWSSCRGPPGRPPAAVRTASRTLKVPRALISKSARGSATLVVTATWPARWSTASASAWRGQQVVHRRGVADVGPDEVGRRPASRSQARLASAPRRLRLSTTTTRCPGRVEPRRGVAADEPRPAGDDPFPLATAIIGHGLSRPPCRPPARRGRARIGGDGRPSPGPGAPLGPSWFLTEVFSRPGRLKEHQSAVNPSRPPPSPPRRPLPKSPRIDFKAPDDRDRPNTHPNVDASLLDDARALPDPSRPACLEWPPSRGPRRPVPRPPPAGPCLSVWTRCLGHTWDPTPCPSTLIRGHDRPGPPGPPVPGPPITDEPDILGPADRPPGSGPPSRVPPTTDEPDILGPGAGRRPARLAEIRPSR